MFEVYSLIQTLFPKDHNSISCLRQTGAFICHRWKSLRFQNSSLIIAYPKIVLLLVGEINHGSKIYSYIRCIDLTYHVKMILSRTQWKGKKLREASGVGSRHSTAAWCHWVITQNSKSK